MRATGAADSPSPPSFRHWLAVGAQPSKPVAWLLDRAGVAPAPAAGRSQPALLPLRLPSAQLAALAAWLPTAGITVNADAIAELALLNFIEMRDLTGQPEFLLRKKIESVLHREQPERWIPLYTQVTFSQIPYSVALERGRQMDRVFAEVMQWPGIAQNWDQPETLAKIWGVADKYLATSY